jgi:hypothetical protein
MPSRKSLIILLAFLFAAALPSVAQASKSIRGPGFRSHVPSGWTVKSTTENGWRVVRVTPPGRSARGRNASIVVIGVTSVKALEKASKKKLPGSDAQLAQDLAAVPGDAANIQPSLQPQATRLAGTIGAILGYHYFVGQLGMSQTATVVRHNRRVYLLQVVSADSLSFIGTQASSLVRANWRWR